MKKAITIWFLSWWGLVGFSNKLLETVKGPYGGDVTLTGGHNGKLYAEVFQKTKYMYPPDNGKLLGNNVGFS